MISWYVAKTKPRREITTAVVLGERGFETYFPLFAPKHYRPRDVEPLFPGYLFVRLDPETPSWLEVRSAPGIAYFLGSPTARERAVPTALPDDVIESIRQRVAAQKQSVQENAFKRGERVVIVGGPLDGMEAVFDGRLSAAGRSRVLVDLVNRIVPVTIGCEQLSKPAPAV